MMKGMDRSIFSIVSRYNTSSNRPGSCRCHSTDQQALVISFNILHPTISYQNNTIRPPIPQYHFTKRRLNSSCSSTPYLFYATSSHPPNPSICSYHRPFLQSTTIPISSTNSLSRDHISGQKEKKMPRSRSHPS